MNRRKFISASLGTAAAVSLSRQAGARQLTSERAFRTTDIAIIGAGLFGSAAARHLSLTNAGVTLIGPAEPESQKTHDGLFASHYDASRLVRGIDPELTWATLARSSIEQYPDLQKLSGIDFYNEIGYMMVTPGGLGEDWFDLPAMREVAAEMDVEIEDLNYAELQKRYPYLDYTPGSSAVLQASGAGYIDPRGLLAAQQTLAVEQGTTLLRDEALTLSNKPDFVEIGLRSGETVRANKVLVATGAYTNASGLLPHKLKFMIRAAMIMESEVAPDTPADYPTTLYAKTDGEEDFWGLLMPPIKYADGRSYIKTMDGYYGPAPLEGMDTLNTWMRSSAHEGHHEVVKRALQEVFPSLEVASTRFKPCLITDTPSHYPYIDMLVDRIGVVTGGNGKAAKSSDEIGRLAAGMIQSGDWPASLARSVFAAQFE
jgi:glycine/D-amino acid oxidase-like deaminating enzyme